MDSTLPLNHERIQHAIDALAAVNAMFRAKGELPVAQAQPQTMLGGGLHARVTGPVKGYYIASHAARPDGAFASYVGDYKICEALPSSYWSARAIVTGRCRHGEATGSAAMASAESAAVRRIDELPVLDDRH